MHSRRLLLALLLLALTSASAAQQWFAVQTNQLTSYSSGDDRGARTAALRSEQLIAVFSEIFHRKDIHLSVPLCVLVNHAAEPGNHDGVLVRTPLANYVIADPAQPERWTQAARSIAALTLEDNYPRAQPWFDSGIANYLAAARFSGDQMALGEPPSGMALPRADEWVPLDKLFAIKEPQQLSAAQQAGFEAESWAVVRWLIDNGRLAQAGTYLNELQSRGVRPERAVTEAFSMSLADLDREVRASLESISAKSMAAPLVEGNLFKSKKISAADAHVLQANLTLFGAEGEHTLRELVAFMRENQENVAVHRSLAWAFLLRHDLENAAEHIRRALALDDSDPAMHYLYARWVNQGDGENIRIESAQARMRTELKAALQRDPNYAAALELLGLADLSGDAVKPALVALQRASALRPRSDRYYLNLARAYEADSNLDAARNLLLYAHAGTDPTVSAEAEQELSELGKRKKQQQHWAEMGIASDSSAKPGKYDNLQEAIAEDEKAGAKNESPEPPKDARKIQYMKGRIVSVECGSAAGATIAVTSGRYTWQIHVADRNGIVLIGAKQFDCGWHNTAVSLNYKQSGTHEGDLVSLEVN